MGTDEQYEKILWAVHYINLYAEELPDESKTSPCTPYGMLQQECRELWYELWGRNTNHDFWLEGAPMDVNRNSLTAWSAALYKTITTLPKEVLSPEEKNINQRLYDTYKIEDDKLSIPEIIESFSPQDSAVFAIYVRVQEIQYAVNRGGEDEFSQQFAGMMRVAARIYGRCFQIFNGTELFPNHVFATAYILHHIGKILYQDYQRDDITTQDDVTAYLIKNAAHFGIRSPFPEHGFTPAKRLQRCKAIWKSLAENPSMENRMFQYMTLTGKYDAYNWSFVDNLIERHNWNMQQFDELRNRNTEVNADYIKRIKQDNQPNNISDLLETK